MHIHTVRLIGMILLAVFVFFTGVLMLIDTEIPQFATVILGLVGIATGVLIFISTLNFKERK